MISKPDIKLSLKILLVEDNPGDVLIFNEHLKHSGIKIELIHSSTLKDAIKQCLDNEFDVILMDLGLPDSVGLETLRKFPLAAMKAPVVVMTGLDDEETALIALKEGAQDYLVKNTLNTENIVRTIRYSIERKKIQEVQKKITLQFSTLASATAAINESEDAASIYRICCNNIKTLLREENVFAIEYLDPQNPYTSYYEWLEPYFDEGGKIKGIDFYQTNTMILNGIQELLAGNKDIKVIEIKGRINELLEGIYSPEINAEIENLLGINKLYILGFSRYDKQYGGIFIYSKKTIEQDEINILEVIANQASLSIHRKTIEKELILSEQRYRVLNKKLEQRVLERTKDLANTNALLEEELNVRIRLEQELTESRDELERRVQERTAELARSEARFHNMFYNHEAVMWLVKPDTGVIVEANKSAEQFYGLPFNTLSQIRVQDLNMAPPGDLKKNMAEAVSQKSNYFIFPHKLASGEIRTVEVYSSPIEINNETLLFSVIHDITERRRMEEALKESEALYKALVNNSMNITLILINNTIEFANDQAVSYFHMPINEIVGTKLDKLFRTLADESGEDRSISLKIFEAAQDNRAVEINVQNLKGAQFYFLVRGSTILYKGNDAVMYIFTDITESKNVEQYVLNKVIETEENDRRRFAADLHDDLGPILSTIKLRLGLMENAKEAEELSENITISKELMGLVVEKVRTISQNIAPHIIENLGLDSAIRDLCKRIMQINNITLEYKSEIENIRFPQSVELHFYRIISELINNSLKHSEAGVIHINLRCIGDTLKLIYYDNGKGYNVQELYLKPGGIGLRSILNRVSLINGTINFQQEKGKTVVKINKKLDPVTSS